MDEVRAGGSKSKSAVPINATARVSKSRMHLKDPLDMSNIRYLEALKSRQQTAPGMDYLNDNIVSASVKALHHPLVENNRWGEPLMYCAALGGTSDVCSGR